MNELELISKKGPHKNCGFIRCVICCRSLPKTDPKATCWLLLVLPLMLKPGYRFSCSSTALAAHLSGRHFLKSMKKREHQETVGVYHRDLNPVMQVIAFHFSIACLVLTFFGRLIHSRWIILLCQLLPASIRCSWHTNALISNTPVLRIIRLESISLSRRLVDVTRKKIQ